MLCLFIILYTNSYCIIVCLDERTQEPTKMYIYNNDTSISTMLLRREEEEIMLERRQHKREKKK